ncbi:MAG: hypothetical protein J0L57_15355 [Burkholderiales bacterium]|nr:hypothetical protein [Burkholderiales bacterium]
MPTHQRNHLIVPGPYLRGVLKLDAGLSAVTTLLLTAGASTLAAATGAPATLLFAIGVALVPWVAFLLWVATRSAVPAALVWAVIGLNAAWALNCVLVALGFGLALTPAGVGFAALQAAGTALLAGLEWLGLRRSAPLPA